MEMWKRQGLYTHSHKHNHSSNKTSFVYHTFKKKGEKNYSDQKCLKERPFESFSLKTFDITKKRPGRTCSSPWITAAANREKAAMGWEYRYGNPPMVPYMVTAVSSPVTKLTWSTCPNMTWPSPCRSIPTGPACPKQKIFTTILPGSTPSWSITSRFIKKE